MNTNFGLNWRAYSRPYLCVICISLLFLHLPVWGLFYDFENKAQLKEWEVIGGDWKIEKGVLKGENTPPAPGFDHGPGIAVGEDTWTDYTFELKIKVAVRLKGGVNVQ